MDEEKRGVRVSDIFYYLIKGRRIIALCALVGLILGVIFSGVSFIRGEMSKEYRIDCSIAISAQTKGGLFSSNLKNPSLDDVHLAEDMSDSVMYVLKSERLLATAIEQANLTGVSVASIRNNLTLSQYNETQIIEVSLYWRSDVEGIRILEAITSVANDTLLDTIKVGNISVINAPKASYIIGGNISASTWIMAAFAGFAVGAIICILKLLIMPTFTSRHDLEYILGIEVLGTVVQERKFNTDVPFAEKGTQIRKDISSLVYILANRMERCGRKKLYLTSTGHQEGRTRLAVNIAEQLAHSGKKTLLVDCDFKNPQLSALFADSFSYENSLNALYNGEADCIDAITHITGCLYLLPAMLDSEPLIMNDALLHVVSEACEGYDYVVIDAAPIGDDAEVMNLNRIADTAVFVLRYDQEEVKDIENAVKRLRESGMQSIGCIINGIKTVRDVVRDAQRLTLFRSKKKSKKVKQVKKEKKEKKEKKRGKKDA